MFRPASAVRFSSACESVRGWVPDCVRWRSLIRNDDKSCLDASRPAWDQPKRDRADGGGFHLAFGRVGCGDDGGLAHEFLPCPFLLDGPSGAGFNIKPSKSNGFMTERIRTAWEGIA